MRHCFIHTQYIDRNRYDRRGNYSEIHSKLFIFQHALPVFKQQQKVEIKVDSEQDHKHGDHAVNICAVIKCNARISVGESSCSRRTERMNDSIIQIHSAKHKEDHFRDRQNKIHLIQQFCRMTNFRNEFIHLRSRHFGPHKRHRIIRIKRSDHHHKNEHSHSADPMCKAPPEIHSFRKSLYILQNSRSGRRKTGNRFKNRINIIRNTIRQKERKRSEQRP